MKKTFIYCAVSSAVGTAIGYFVGSYIQKTKDEKIRDQMAKDLKEHYSKSIPVVREANIEDAEPIENTEETAIFKSEINKPPFSEWLKQNANKVHNTDYNSVFKEKHGPPPPPITKNAFDEHVQHQLELSIDDEEYDGSVEEKETDPDDDQELAEANADARFPDSSNPKNSVMPNGDAPDKPFLISENDFLNGYRHLEKKSMIAYEEDHVLVDDDNPEEQANSEDWLGTFDPISLFWQASEDDDQPAETIWVRNFAMGADIEVSLYHRSWSEVRAQRDGGW